MSAAEFVNVITTLTISKTVIFKICSEVINL